MKFFKKETDISALSKYKSWDHEISLISEILSKIGLIYILFYTKLKILKDILFRKKNISKISYFIYSKEKQTIKILHRLLKIKYNYN